MAGQIKKQTAKPEERQGEKRKKQWNKTKAYRVLRAQMECDLRQAALFNAFFLEKVDRYMSLWVQAKELEEDLQERGIRVKYQNGTQRGETENKSLDRLMKVYDRMDELHRQLGYQEQVKAGKAAAVRAAESGEDDEL